MTIRYRPPPSGGQRAAAALLVLSGVVTLLAAANAWRLTPPPGAETTPQSRALEGVPDVDGEPLWSAVRAVERDPFHPERRAPDERYLLPEDDGAGPPAFGEAVPQGPLRLVGTAVSGEGGGFAMCQLGNDPPRIVRVGETLGGFTLRSVARGAADFTREDGTPVTLEVPSAPARSEGSAHPRQEEHP